MNATNIQPKTTFACRLRLATNRLRDAMPAELQGHVAAAGPMTVSIAGLNAHVAIGDRVDLHTRAGPCLAEIVRVGPDFAQAMLMGPAGGLVAGCRVTAPISDRTPPAAGLRVADSWIGRVLDPLGRPLDGQPPPAQGMVVRTTVAQPPPAMQRARLGARIDLGVRVLDAFTPCVAGQRLGLFAGSGVGKSTLLAMLARHAASDVIVLALVGERGREAREFLEDVLGPAGRARGCAILATSDDAPLMRREAARAALTVAEHFRDQGARVLLLMDSVTRFCHALREIGLAAGEAPVARGYPPSVFAELPRLLERAGPGLDGGSGSITALFTVLVDGDDLNDPVADAVRGILDGHVILDRAIAEAGRFPAVDIARSLSRTAPSCQTPEEADLAARARSILATHAELADMIRLGAYHPGGDPVADAAIRTAPRLIEAMRQRAGEPATREAAVRALREALQ